MKKNVSEDVDRKDLLKSLFYLIVCAICVFAVSFAWFNNNKVGKVEELEFAAVEAIGFQISLTEDGTYANSVELAFPDNLVFKPLSGDGDKLYCPAIPADVNAGEYLLNNFSSVDWGEPISYDPNAEQNPFYKVRLYFSADNPGYVSFTPSEMCIKPAAEPEYRQSSSYEGEGGSVTVEDPSQVLRPIQDSLLQNVNQGSITKDYIAAAMRIKIYSPDTTPGIQQNSLIVLNPCYCLECEHDEGGEYTYSMNELGEETALSELYFYDGSTKKSYASIRSFYYSGNNTSPVYLLRLQQQEGEGLYTGWVDMTIWVEGFDPEASDIFAGGQIDCNLRFRYVEDPPPSNPTQSTE